MRLFALKRSLSNTKIFLLHAGWIIKEHPPDGQEAIPDFQFPISQATESPSACYNAPMMADFSEIPRAPGSYALHLRLTASQTLTVGALGRIRFPAGDYVYLGSAHGPGGLRARLGRHLRGEGALRWHVDYLRRAAAVIGYGYALVDADDPDPLPRECAWSQSLASLPEARIIAPGFGASDCRSGCAAHLVYFPRLETDVLDAVLGAGFKITSAV